MLADYWFAGICRPWACRSAAPQSWRVWCCCHGCLLHPAPLQLVPLSSQHMILQACSCRFDSHCMAMLCALILRLLPPPFAFAGGAGVVRRCAGSGVGHSDPCACFCARARRQGRLQELFRLPVRLDHILTATATATLILERIGCLIYACICLVPLGISFRFRILFALIDLTWPAFQRKCAPSVALWPALLRFCKCLEPVCAAIALVAREQRQHAARRKSGSPAQAGGMRRKLAGPGPLLACPKLFRPPIQACKGPGRADGQAHVRCNVCGMQCLPCVVQPQGIQMAHGGRRGGPARRVPGLTRPSIGMQTS